MLETLVFLPLHLLSITAIGTHKFFHLEACLPGPTSEVLSHEFQ